LALSPQELQKVYRRQAKWFAGERSRLLRKVEIAGKSRVLDLGCGCGETLTELGRRAAGPVIGVDHDIQILRLSSGTRTCARAEALPFADGCFDLVFTQMFFMWARPEIVLPEIGRVLAPGGQLIACAEPDYGGALDHPPGSAGLAALAEQLRTEGADVEIARKLGSEMQRAGFEVSCGLHPARPLDVGKGDSDLLAPELADARADLEFLFMPYFWFLGT
jgi:SAM-dependent methyltransferase